MLKYFTSIKNTTPESCFIMMDTITTLLSHAHHNNLSVHIPLALSPSAARAGGEGGAAVQ